MKKRFSFKNLIVRKNLLLTVVALVLVMLMVVGVSYSWIEQISNVEMTLGGEKSPMHISTDKLNKPMEAELNNSDDNKQEGTPKTIDLSKYFYESGNMHLSSCYSDSKSFYFPKKANIGTSGVPNYRLGTKDDVNVNYLSVTFKLRNTEDFEQAYWFYKPDNNEKMFTAKSSADANLEKQVRMSVTVDGATSIFSAADTPTYKSVSSISDSNVTTTDCQSFASYQYDPDHNRQNDSENANRNKTRGANGNTLFVLPAGTSSIVTVKMWLEYDGVDSTASLSDINLKLVSSFTKTRKIYLTDQSFYNNLTAGRKWLSSDNAALFLALKDDINIRWQFAETSANDHKHFYVTVPAYYNNEDVYILRCNRTWGAGDSGRFLPENNAVHYWNMWETKLPDTYDDRTFTEYSPDFGSWRDQDKISYFYFIDAWGWGNSDSYTHNGVYAYMWDNNTVENNKATIENHSWVQGSHGMPMYFTNKWANGRNSGNYRVYVIYYDADFTHVIFNNNKDNDDKKTSSIPIQKGKFYDLASDRWIDNYGDAAFDTFYERVKWHGNWALSGNWSDIQMYRSSLNNDIYYGTTWLTGGNTYGFRIKDNGTDYGFVSNKKFCHNGSETNTTFDATFRSGTASQFVENDLMTVDIDANTNTINIYTGETGIYTIRYDSTNHSIAVDYPSGTRPDDGGTSGGSSGGSSGGGGNMDGYETQVTNSYVHMNSSNQWPIYTDGNGNFKATIPLTTETKWVTVLMNGSNYRNVQASQVYTAGSSFNGLYLSTSNSNNFGLTAATAGNYVITFRYDNGNTNTIYVSSILKE